MSLKSLARTVLPAPVLNLARKALRPPRSKPRCTAPPEGNAALHCTIAYNRFGGYCVPLSGLHKPAVQRILAGDVYEAETIELLCKKCGVGDIIHAGTYFGDFLPALANSHAVRVWAFEPNPESYECARITTLINRLDNVTLRNAALSDKPGKLEMTVADEAGRALGGSSHLISNGSTAGRTVTVEALAIDAAIPADRKVSVIQLDVEGNEEAALSGAMQTIERWRPLIVVETLPHAAWLETRLYPLGYRATGEVCGNSILEASSYKSAEVGALTM